MLTFYSLIGAQTIVKVKGPVKSILPLKSLHKITNLRLSEKAYFQKFPIKLPLSLKNRILSPARLPVPPSGQL